MSSLATNVNCFWTLLVSTTSGSLMFNILKVIIALIFLSVANYNDYFIKNKLIENGRKQKTIVRQNNPKQPTITNKTNSHKGK
jgi:hypothetical protein